MTLATLISAFNTIKGVNMIQVPLHRVYEDTFYLRILTDVIEDGGFHLRCEKRQAIFGAPNEVKHDVNIGHYSSSDVIIVNPDFQ